MNTRRTWLPEEENTLMQIWYSNRFLHSASALKTTNGAISDSRRKHYMYEAATRLFFLVTDIQVTSNQVKEKIRNTERNFRKLLEADSNLPVQPNHPFNLWLYRVQRSYTAPPESDETIDYRHIPDSEIFFKHRQAQKIKKPKKSALAFDLPPLPNISLPVPQPSRAKLPEFLAKYQNFSTWLTLIYEESDPLHTSLKEKLAQRGITNLRGVWFADPEDFTGLQKHVQNMINASFSLQLE